MDFGLGKYLEMFRERFGEKPHTCLIVFITIVLVSVGMNLIYANAIFPLIQLIGIAQAGDGKDAFIYILGGLIGFFLVLFAIYFASILYVKGVTRNFDKLKAGIVELINEKQDRL